MNSLEAHFEGLRSFADTYTEGAIKRERSGLSLLRVIQRMDKVADREIDIIHQRAEEHAAQGKSPAIACRKGCGYCCYQVVAASIPEVLLVADYLRKNRSTAELEATVKKLAAYL